MGLSFPLLLLSINYKSSETHPAFLPLDYSKVGIVFCIRSCHSYKEGGWEVATYQGSEANPRNNIVLSSMSKRALTHISLDVIDPFYTPWIVKSEHI